MQIGCIDLLNDPILDKIVIYTKDIYQQDKILLWSHVVNTQWWYFNKLTPRVEIKPQCSLPDSTYKYNVWNMEYIDEWSTDNNVATMDAFDSK